MSSSAAKAQQKRVVFDSDDSSASDNEGGDQHHGGDSLAREMAAAAERERRKNPHAETGRAKAPRTHPLASASSGGAATTANAEGKTATGTTAKPYKAKKMNLFDSDSSSSESEAEVEKQGKSMRSVAPRTAPSTSSSASSSATNTNAAADASAVKVAHVQGLSFRAVKEKQKQKATKKGGDAEDKSGSDAENAVDGGDDEDEDDANVLRINKAFATRYEEQKRKQELHTLAEKYKGKIGSAAAALDSDNDEEDEEDDAEEDEDAVLLTRENNLRFAKALLAVRKATVPLPTSAEAEKPATAAVLLPKEELLKDRFFPPAEEQVRANTDIFEHYVERKRHGKDGGHRFTLSDEYHRALRATADSEDAVVDASEGSERDGLRKLRPQNAEEAKLRAAFLRDVADSADTFEVVRGTKSNKTDNDGAKDGDDGDDEDEERRLEAAREEEKRLLEEAFSLGKAAAKKSKRKNTEATGDEAADEAEASSEGKEDDDAFLRDFFIQELWRPGASAKKRKAGGSGSNKKAAGQDGANNEGAGSDDGDEEEEEGTGGSYYERLAQLAREEEDEAFFNDAEVWEREYQEKKYRHQEAEEEAAAHIQTFPRPIGEAAVGLLRKPDTSRKDARQRRRERAEAAHAQQVEELKRLKHLKRKEIEDQRALIASVAGLTVKGAAGRHRGGADAFADGADAEEEAELAKLKAVWSDKDLDAPFDPAEFDKKMAQLFNDDYYDEKNVDEDEIAYFDEELDKEGTADGEDGDFPQDDSLEEIKSGAAPALFAAESLEDAKAMLPATSKAQKNKNKKKSESFFDDAFGPLDGGDGVTAADNNTSDALSLLYPSEALQALEKERQHLNELIAASSQKQQQAAEGSGESNEELLERLKAALKKKEEEYYQLHRDSAAGDGGPAFRYREVEPEDFTLSVEEILALDDRQLNMIAPMNCYAAYLDKDSNARDRRRIERRRQKGFREVASDRTSRRYGDVGSTALLNPETINEEEGAAIAEKLSKRLREEGEDPDAPLPVPASRQAKGPRHEGGGNERGRENGRGGFNASRGGRGGNAFRGGSAPASSFRGRGGSFGGGRGSFNGPHRGGSARGRGGFRGGRGGPRGGH